MKAGFYLELIRTVFQPVDAQGKLRHRVVAFTSATPGEGVSYVVDLIARELAAQTERRVLRVDARALQLLDLPNPKAIINYCEETEIDNLLTLTSPNASAMAVGVGPGRQTLEWDKAPEFRVDCLKALRWNFDYILIDCSSLATSSDASTMAPLVDGVSIVVKAAQTRRGQIQRVQQMVETAGGNFLGFILNQRRYPMPGWLYQRL